MKKQFILYSSIAAICLFASGCGSAPNQTNVQSSSTPATVPATAPAKKEETIKAVTLESLVQAFKDGGLEAETPTKMEAKDYGMAPKLGNGLRVLVPSLGKDIGGRVLQFENKADLDNIKKYYDELGKSSAMLYSFTYAKGLFLIQMSGDMKEDQFKKYQDVMDKLIK
ncbi:hypothetical protein [Paenibacillus sp. FSL H7-0331]|uniref:hypothetical protein n=1 Tax=Paenibacillus sp. FSL H7-0331 TaxID=1920421 RepID=UPI00096C16B1|nr:hypothetical protein [Paenibacillus sp. FSL H7-0331]OMF03608.1 hypothetical protein BK127_35260 [Paenibacillus sp. FSL H7-0331]